VLIGKCESLWPDPHTSARIYPNGERSIPVSFEVMAYT
jgi:hypothetical protein